MAPRESITGESKNYKHLKHRKALLAISQEMLTWPAARSPVLPRARLLTVKIQKNTAQESPEPQPTSPWMMSTGLAPTDQNTESKHKRKQSNLNGSADTSDWYTMSVKCIHWSHSRCKDPGCMKWHLKTLWVHDKSLPHSSSSLLHPVVLLSTQFSQLAHHLHRNKLGRHANPGRPNKTAHTVKASWSQTLATLWVFSFTLRPNNTR